MTEEARAETETIGRYVLHGQIASGGMGAVHLAQVGGADGFGRWVAVKTIRPHLVSNRRFVTMFLDEIRVISGIHHPNVCSVIDLGREQGVPYLVMEYLRGQTFLTVLERARFDGEVPLWLAARVIADAAHGLHAAHEALDVDGHPLHVVHRDVSPQNVFVTDDGLSKVLDFGVARARGRLGVSVTGEVKGKFAYMAPEQLTSRSVDRRCDVWALGVVLWEAVSGQRLFRGESEADTVTRVMQGEIPRLVTVAPRCPAVLDDIVMATLQRNAETRTASADDLAEALETFLVSVGEPTGASRIARWMHEHFRDEIAEREAALRSGHPHVPRARDAERDETVLDQGAAASVTEATRLLGADTVVSPPLHEASVAPEAEAAAEAADRTRPARVGPRRTAWWAGAAAAVLLGLVALLLGTLLGHDPPREDGHRARSEGAAVAKGPVPPPRSASTHTTVHASAHAAPQPTRLPPPRREPHAASQPSTHPAPQAPPPDPAPQAATNPGVRSRPLRAPHAATASRPRRPTAEPPGVLDLMAVPAAEVFLEGRRIGVTPLVSYALPAGRHRLLLRSTADGSTRTLVVRVPPGQVLRQSIRFGP